MYAILLLLSTFIFSVLFQGIETRCKVGLLDDTNDAIMKLTFMSETKLYHLGDVIKTISVDHSYDTLNTTCNLLEKGVIGLFGPQTERNHEIVRSICFLKDIPHIESRWDSNPQKSTFTINLYPHSTTFSEALADLVEAKNWETFAVFYENHESLSRVSGILRKQNKFAISLRQLDVESVGVYITVLREARKQDFKNFVVDCSIKCLINFLRQAQQIGLMTSDHSYVFTNPDLHTINLDPYKYSETNITWVRLMDPDSDTVMDLAKRISKQQRHLDVFGGEMQDVLSNDIPLEAALLADGLQLLNMTLKNLPKHKKCGATVFCGDSSSWYDGASVLLALRMKSFEGITGHVEIDEMGYRTDFKLDIMELLETGIVKIGTWDYKKKLQLFQKDEDSTSIANNSYKVMVTKTPPYCMLRDSEGPLNGNDRYEGFAIDIIHELSKIEKFNYTIIVREDNKNGDYDKSTDQWSGMIGDVISGFTDLAISDLTITAERRNAVDFTTPFMNMGVSILYRKPTKAPPNFFSFAAPFAKEVWVCIGVAYFIVSVSLFIMGRLCTTEWTNPYPCNENPEYLVNQLSLRNSFWFMLGSVLQQGSEIAPIAYATRMTAGSWWFFTLIMVSTYTANLAAFLAIETPERPFADVYGLAAKAEQLGIKYGAKSKGATETFFRDAKSEELQTIYKYMNANRDDVMVADNDKGVERAESERYAFFMESTSIEYSTQRHCTLTKIGKELDDKGYGIAVKKNASLLRHRLNTAILRIKENGKIDEFRRKWWEERRGGGRCSDESKEGEDAVPLSLNHVGGVFWVTVYGTITAVFLVLVEMTLHIFKQSIKYKKPFFDELKQELKFYLKFKGLVKPVRKKNSKSKSPESRETELQPAHEEPALGFLPDITNAKSF